MNAWVILITVYLVLFLSSPLIAILHELGHAFAYLLLTKPDKIDIYIGSYGDTKRQVQFRVGKLQFHIKKSFPFVKGIGLCMSSKAETNYLKRIVILLAGTVFTLFWAAILSIVAFNSDVHLLVKISCYIFLGLSAVSLISNLVPRDVNPFNTNTLENDGKQLLFTIKAKTALADYVEALQFIGNKEYEPAIIKLQPVLAVMKNDVKILRFLIFTTLNAKRFDDTAVYIKQLELQTELLPNDLFYKGCWQSFTHQHDEAITTYSKVLKKEKNNVLALNNIAYELIEKGAHEVALRALQRAIKHKEEYDQSYGNLGYSKILQNDLEAGRETIEKCLSLNPGNALACKALGIYYLRLKDWEKANTNFNKALEFDSDINVSAYTDELDQLASLNKLSDTALA